MQHTRDLLAGCLLVAFCVLTQHGTAVDGNVSDQAVSTFASTHSAGGTAVGTLIWNGTTAGTERNIGGLQAYVSEPKQPYKAAVLVVTDVYGYKTSNVRHWADSLAKQGFLAVVPDFFRGSPRKQTDSQATFAAWRAKFPRSQALKDAAAVLAAIQSQYKAVKKIGVEGFCWGGQYAVLLTHGQSPPVSAAVVYHGALLTAADVEGINAPILFQQSDPALDPNLNTTTYNQFKGILDTKHKAGLDANITSYPGMKHAFVMRGGSSAAVTSAASSAFGAGAAFLAKYLAS